ncbi:MAG: DNA polymerase domain-containing protein [Thermoproteota archaeon]
MPKAGTREIRFWLLDVNYETRGGVPEVWLWGVSDGKRVLLLERRFKPYFYLVLSGKPENVLPVLEKESLKAKRALEFEVLDKKLFGKPVKAVKVTCPDPEEVERLAGRFSKTEGVSRALEEDIRFSTRYMIDTGVTPCAWHVADVREAEDPPEACVDEIYCLAGVPRMLEEARAPRLKIMSFHVLSLGKSGSPQLGKDPVYAISVNNSERKPSQFVMKEGGDESVIRSFISYVRDYDPDVIAGFGANQNDWRALSARAQHLGLKLAVDRVGSEPHTSLYGHTSITGRAGIDLLDMAKDIQDLDVESLEELARYLGIKTKGRLDDLDETELAELWRSGDSQRVLRFSAQRAEAMVEVAESALEFLTQLSDLVKIPLDHVATAAVGFRVESYLVSLAHRVGELVPKRVDRGYATYAGGIVLSPKPGMQRNVAVLDFRSMYPNLMLMHNISPDTYTEETGKDLNVAPEVGHRFKRSPEGFYKRALADLLKARKELNEKLERLQPGTTERKVLEARQRAIKVVTNALYGYCGWTGARWYSKEVAEATAAWGRSVITRAVKIAKSVGLEVVYGDTDSIFVRNDRAKIKRVLKEIGEEIGLEARPEKVYEKVLFTEAKKKYCGLLATGEIDLVGLEAVRGDWARVAKTAQKGVIEIVLREEDAGKAVAFLKEYVSRLLAGSVPVGDLVIWKTLTKPLEDYEVKAPHVEAARIMKEKGWSLAVGEKVGYVIVKGEGKLYQKARPLAFAKGLEPDYDYYLRNQVVPAAARVLENFGIGEKALLEKVLAT